MAEEMSASPRVMARHEQLETFCIRVLEKLGVPREEAEITAKTMVTANLRGVDTHGVLRLPLYAARLKTGAIAPSVNLTTEKETVATALLNGHDGIGQVISYRAMEMAIRKAAAAGVSYVAVRNSNHFGAAAFYPMMALGHDMIGLRSATPHPVLPRRAVSSGSSATTPGRSPCRLAGGPRSFWIWPTASWRPERSASPKKKASRSPRGGHLISMAYRPPIPTRRSRGTSWQ